MLVHPSKKSQKALGFRYASPDALILHTPSFFGMSQPMLPKNIFEYASPINFKVNLEVHLRNNSYFKIQRILRRYISRE